MDQLSLLTKLDRVAGACRRLGLSALPPAGKRLLQPLMPGGVSVTVDGFEVIASIEHRHYLAALRKDEVESLMARLFARVIGPGMTVIDIGAFVGWYTLLAARQVGPYGKVYAFEPDPRNYALLSENLLRNKLHERVVVIPKAVSDDAGARTFFLHGADRNVKLFIECNPSSLRLAGNSPDALIAKLDELGFEILMIDESNRRLAALDSRVETAKYVNLYCTRGD